MVLPAGQVLVIPLSIFKTSQEERFWKQVRLFLLNTPPLLGKDERYDDCTVRSVIWCYGWWPKHWYHRQKYADKARIRSELNSAMKKKMCLLVLTRPRAAEILTGELKFRSEFGLESSWSGNIFSRSRKASRPEITHNPWVMKWLCLPAEEKVVENRLYMRLNEQLSIIAVLGYVNDGCV